MRLFGRLLSVTALALLVMLLQPTNVQADPDPDPDAEETANSQLECAALYLIATGAFPSNEKRKADFLTRQKVFEHFYIDHHSH